MVRGTRMRLETGQVRMEGGRGQRRGRRGGEAMVVRIRRQHTAGCKEERISAERTAIRMKAWRRQRRWEEEEAGGRRTDALRWWRRWENVGSVRMLGR